MNMVYMFYNPREHRMNNTRVINEDGFIMGMLTSAERTGMVKNQLLDHGRIPQCLE